MKKIEKEQWFVVGLRVLAEEGFTRITIDNLCRVLQVTKGAFYHRFKNIDGYVEALMKYWIEENTFSFISRTDELGDAGVKLQALGDMAAYAANRSEDAIRGWGYSNPVVESYVKQADRIRMDYLAGLNAESGLDAGPARDMSVIQYALLVGMQHLCPNLRPEEFKNLQDKVINKFR